MLAKVHAAVVACPSEREMVDIRHLAVACPPEREMADIRHLDFRSPTGSDVLEPVLLSTDSNSPRSSQFLPTRHRPSRSFMASSSLAASLLLLGASSFREIPGRPWPGRPWGVSAGAAVREDIEVAGGLLRCSAVGEDCTGTSCCSITGYKCFQKNTTFAGCLESCPPPGEPVWMCRRPPRLRKMKPSKASPGTTFFCFEMLCADKGLPDKNWDLSLVRTQLQTKTSIFGCEDWMVFSDVRTWISPGPPQKLYTRKVDAPHVARTPFKGMWLNTPTFQNVWIDIRADGRWSKHDWTVKVDPDTVFLPSLLRAKLANQEITDSGIYITNCRGVHFGFFGSMEVMSHTAFGVLILHVEDCNRTLAWHTPGSEWAEDLFAQRCMDLFGIDNVEDFTLISDGVCDAIGMQQKSHLPALPKIQPPCSQPAPGLHPFRTPAEYFTCLAQAQKAAQGAYPISRKGYWIRAATVAVQQLISRANADGFHVPTPVLNADVQASDGIQVQLHGHGGQSCRAHVLASLTSEPKGLDTVHIRKLEATDVQLHASSGYVFRFALEAATTGISADGFGIASAKCGDGASQLQRHANVSIRKQAGSLRVLGIDVVAYASLKVLFLHYRLNRFVIPKLQIGVNEGRPAECQAEGPAQVTCTKLAQKLDERFNALVKDHAFQQSVAAALTEKLNRLLPVKIA